MHAHARREREAIRREEDEVREAHRRAFDEMVERARANPPPPHDPMRFRAVPPGACARVCGWELGMGARDCKVMGLE